MNNNAMEQIETASVDELRGLQLERMKKTLQHAYQNSTVYKKKFDEAGVHPDDLKSLDDLAKFPFTTKQDLRENYPFGMFAVPQEQIVRVHASSGTTGQPTVVGYTQNDINTWSNVVARSLRAAGLSSKDTIQVSYGYGLFTGGLGAHYGVERLGATVIPMSGGQTDKQAQPVDREPKWPRDQHDQQRLHDDRRDLLQRPTDQQRGARQRRDESALVRAGHHLQHQVGASHRGAHQRRHGDDARDEPLQRRAPVHVGQQG